MLDGLSISGYRSFGAKEVRIADLSQTNVFIGKNNCGKSNVLRFVKYLASVGKQLGSHEGGPKLDPYLDFCIGDAKRRISVGIQVKKDSYTNNIYNQIAEPFGQANVDFASSFGQTLWFSFQPTEKLQPTPESLARWRELIQANCNDAKTNILTGRLCNYTQGSPEKRVADIATAVHGMVDIKLDVRLIGAFRQISESGDDRLSGAGLIKELRKLQSPEFSQYDASKRRFEKIVTFVRSVLGESKARLEIPAEKDDIYVVIDDKTLPLSSLGTGIHELVILASAVTLVDNALFCIEEPEIHLHPELQKKFARYIADNTSNQYLIASHSNAFFDLPGVNTYMCWLEGGVTNCGLASGSSEKHALLLDMGYRPSDLLQANYIVWVEGPSDRIYINHWIRAKAPDLIEGLHYAIMFYGGRLLSHLSYDEAESDDSMVEDFIHLSCLNRSACIVMDSDRNAADQALNQTKQRIQREFESKSRLVWITAGRTIENYIPENLLNQAIEKVHPRTKKEISWARFGDLTRVNIDKTFDKVAVARNIAGVAADFSMLDLDSPIKRLVECIREHNS